MVGTVIPGLTGQQFAARLADLFPRGWCSADAAQAGNVYALLLSIGNELAFLQGEVRYAALAQRLATETFPELDDASVDFLGNLLPRPAGMSDASYAAAIIADLFRPAATRSALQNAIATLTGYEPRMLEPWSVLDTGSWGNKSYWNVDTAANPARWGNGSLRYQGFIETAPAAIPAVGPNNPVLCWGTAYWNVPGYFFGIIPEVAVTSVDSLVNRLHAYGTVVWIKIVGTSGLVGAVAPGVITGLTATPAGTSSIALAWTAPTVGSAPLTFIALYRQTGQTSFLTGPSVSVTTVTVSNLSPGVVYDFEIVTQNVAGSSTSGFVTAATSLVPPSPATNLTATQVQATAVTLLWSPPITGTPPFSYSINYRINGTTVWSSFPVGLGTTGVSVIGLQPQTTYDFEVISSN